VQLRPVQEADLSLLAGWLNDPEISESVGGWSFPVSLAEQRSWFERSLQDQTTRRWIVETRAGHAIGLTGLWHIDFRNSHAMTALKLGSRDVRGKGYGTDAIMTVMAYAFRDVGLNRLWAEILRFNEASYRAYVVKCGWKVEGVRRQHVFRTGEFRDQLQVGILRSEFESLSAMSEYAGTTAKAEVEIRLEHLAAPLHSILRK
jgi:RimJ/RimL family protein N-acetyltransferase